MTLRSRRLSDALVGTMAPVGQQALGDGDLAVLGRRMAGLVAAVGGASTSLRGENVSANDRAVLEGILDRSVAALGVMATALEQGR